MSSAEIICRAREIVSYVQQDNTGMSCAQVNFCPYSLKKYYVSLMYHCITVQSSD